MNLAGPVLLLVCVGALATPAHATNLKGIKAVGILVEKLDEDSRACGISEASIESAAKTVLQQSKLKLAERKDAPYLTYTVTTVRTGKEGCAAALVVGLAAFGKFESEWGTTNQGTYDAWSSSGIVVNAKSRAGKQLERFVGELTDKFVAAWSKDNE